MEAENITKVKIAFSPQIMSVFPITVLHPALNLFVTENYAFAGSRCLTQRRMLFSVEVVPFPCAA